MVCAAYSTRDTTALRTTPLLESAGVYYHPGLNVLLCRFCGYLLERASLAHVFKQHNRLVQCAFDDCPNLCSIVSQVGKRNDEKVIVDAFRREADRLCGDIHGWEEEADPMDIDSEGSVDQQPQQQQHGGGRRTKTLPRSIDDCAAAFKHGPADGHPLSPIPLLPVFKGLWCEEHSRPCMSHDDIKRHVQHHNQHEPGFNE